jgi:succinate dehydrogenase/fumarate reductase flavoprotein subunit
MKTYQETVDVLVIGGGTAGAIAAIQAVREHDAIVPDLEAS